MLPFAHDGMDTEIINAVIERVPAATEWTSSTQRALNDALSGQNKNQVRLLLTKHKAPPTPEGKSVPLLAYAIAKSDSSLFTTLLACGADPNTILSSRADKEFLELLPVESVRSYVAEDKDVT